MIRLLILLLLLSGVVQVALAQVYRWTDEDGVVHFSDRPQPGAEEIDLPQPNTFSAPPTQQRSKSADAAEKDQQDADQKIYRTVSFARPTQDEVLRNTGGVVDVSVNSVPSLRRGHRLIIFLDGQPVETLTSGRIQTQLTEVVRGQHSLKAEIRAADDQVVGESDTVTFTVKQTSIQNPSNSLAPTVPSPTPR